MLRRDLNQTSRTIETDIVTIKGGEIKVEVELSYMIFISFTKTINFGEF